MNPCMFFSLDIFIITNYSYAYVDSKDSALPWSGEMCNLVTYRSIRLVSLLNTSNVSPFILFSYKFLQKEKSKLLKLKESQKGVITLG